MRNLSACTAILLYAFAQPVKAQDILLPWSIFDQPGGGRERPVQRAKLPVPGALLQESRRSAQSAPSLSRPAPSAEAAWRVLHTAWTERDEKGYEDFVQRIGESDCRSAHQCLTSAEANPLYHGSNPPGMQFYADCADLPYVLRAYYAWKNGLPFSYSAAVASLGPSGDLRFTAGGNRVIARHDLVGPSIDARRAFPKIVNTISSAHYRYPPRYTSQFLPDHYPVRIAPSSIKPGTIIYEASGHVAVVYKVTPEGRIHYMDAHPDNSLTRSIYGKSFLRASPAMGAGFKRWRPQTLVGAVKLTDGTLKGGGIVLTADKDIPDWSEDQFYGTAATRPMDWRMAKFEIGGENLDFHDYVRKRLANVGFKYDPLDETRSMVRSLCDDVKYRIDAVDVALKAGIHARPHPDRLPNNIYATDGDWEIYSTPSRDARLKTEFQELRDQVARFLALAAEGSQTLAYMGNDLRRDLRQVYSEETGACTITYMRSNGSEKRISFDEIAHRLFLLSFDPYHCIELRWGAHEAEELSTCPDGSDKRLWYEAEQRLRNQTGRTYDVLMGFSLGDLKRGAVGSGVDTPPDIDVSILLRDANP